jgi:hypothetical protein
MSTVPVNNRNSQFVDELKQMLTSLRNAPLREVYCDRCGFLMTHVSTHFWMEDVPEAWEIPLPYCANCHPEVGSRHSLAA